MVRNRLGMMFTLAMLALVTGVGLWIPAHWATDKSARILTGYPAAQHALLLALGFALPGALTAVGLRRESGGNAAMKWLVGVQVVLFAAAWLPGRSLMSLAAVIFAGLAWWSMWPSGESRLPERIGTVALALTCAGGVFLLTVEATDFAAPYRLATSLLFRGSTVLFALALLAGRIGGPPLSARSGFVSVRLNLALSLFAASFGVEFVSSVVLRAAWPETLPHVLRALGGLWLLGEVSLPIWSAKHRIGSDLTETGQARAPYFPRVLAYATIAGVAFGFLSEAFAPAELAHTMHFTHMGVLGFLILLPEGRPDSKRERMLYWAAAALLLLAAPTRATAHVWPHIYRSHLLYAAFLFLPGAAWFAFVRVQELRRIGGNAA